MTRFVPAAFEALPSGPATPRRACCQSRATGEHLRPRPGPALGRAGDRHEQEADRIADAVTSDRPGGLTGPLPVTPLFQGQADEDGGKKMLRAEAPGSDAVRPPRTGRALGTRDHDGRPHPRTAARRGADPLSRAASAVASGGQPLRAAERAFFEPRFGRDLSRVRLHGDARADEAARGIGARAYTLGSHIAFAAGQYAPDRRSGRRLLAHELAHTLQQTVQRTPAPVSAMRGVRIQRKGGPVPIEIEIEEATPEQRKDLERRGVKLPSATADATRHRDYVDRRIQAVGYGLLLGGYMLYVDRLEKPIFVSADMVDPGGTEPARTSNAIFPSYRAAVDQIPVGPPAPGRGFPAYAFFRSHGGVVFPTILTRANAPKTLETMDAAVKKLATTVQKEMSVLALGLAGGMVLRGAVAVIARARGLGAAIARRFRGNTPPPVSRLKPVNGRINVGGGFEKGANEASNLQPFIEGTGGPAAGSEVPNLVRGRFEQIAEFFAPGSARLIYSNRLPGSRVNWEEAARGAYTVLAKDGQLSLNVWVESREMFEAIVAALTRAKFRNVRALGQKTGPGVVITGVK